MQIISKIFKNKAYTKQCINQLINEAANRQETFKKDSVLYKCCAARIDALEDLADMLDIKL